MSNCDTCDKPKTIARDDFARWWNQTPAERFTPLREFLADYCTCEVPVE